MSGKFLAARDAFGEGTLSWTDDDIRAQLVSGAYVFDEASQRLSNTVGDSVPVTGRTMANGWARAAQMLFRQVKGPVVKGVVFYRNDGLLIMHCDNVQDFPMQPNGGDILVD